MKNTLTILIALLLAPFASLHAAEAPKPTHPNILFIMVDEMKWNVMSCAGHEIVKTPHLDQLAREGTRFATAYISEFLLQSVDNTIRVFPCWPKDKDARFTNLRAQGGFLVSAEQRAGQIVKLDIVSTVGGLLRLLDPRTGKLIHREMKPGEKVAIIP